MCQQWKDELSGSPGGAVMHVNKWLARTTLDVIGEGPFIRSPQTQLKELIYV